jgi:hypothetical protein
MAQEIQFKSTSHLTKSSGSWSHSMQITLLDLINGGKSHKTKHVNLISDQEFCNLELCLTHVKYYTIIYLLNFNNFLTDIEDVLATAIC